jgi:hypothetical protein
MHETLKTRVGTLLFLFCYLLPWTTIPASAAESTELASSLHDLPPDRLLEVTLEDGSVQTGFLVRARADSLFLDPGNARPPVGLATNEVLRVRERRSNAGRGAGWGVTSGALIGGGLGLLSGLYVASINDRDDGDVAPVLVFTAGGAALGAGVFGLTGWGIGALSTSWRDVWVDDARWSGAREAGQESAPTRLNLAAGAGAIEIRDESFGGFAWRAGLSKPITPHLEMGPHFEFVHVDGAVVREVPGGGTETIATDNLFQASFGTRLYLKESGFGPYANLGAGWYFGNGGYLGGHVGGGLRTVNPAGTDFSLDARWHFNITEIDRGSDAGFLTVTAGIAFDL